MGKRKTPAVKQKKGTSSVNSRNSKKKMSAGHTDLNESFLQSTIHTESDPTVDASVPQSPQVQDKSDSILAMLHKLDESNQALIRRVSDLESQKTVSKKSSEIQSQSDVPTLPTQHNLHSLAATYQNSIQQTASDIRPNNTYLRLPRVETPLHQVNPVTTLSQPLQANATSFQVGPPSLLAQQADTHTTHFPSDGVLPGINVFMQNQNISQSVAQVLASYKAQAKQKVSQGKAPTKNQEDIISQKQ